MDPVLSEQRQLRLEGGTAFKRLDPVLAENGVPTMRVDFSERPARVFVPVIVEPVDRAACIGHPDQLRDGIRQGAELTLAGLKCGLRALALGNFFRRDVDADNFARRVAESRGSVSDTEIAALRNAGFDEASVIEIVVNVALNVLTNYVNNVAQTDIDFPKVSAKLAA